jgi:ABC-type branched-subunit amino acid transport system substrate-binding protein
LSTRARSEGFGRAWRIVACAAAVLIVAACTSINLGRPDSARGTGAATAPDVIGAGSVPIAMLLPESAPGNAAETAKAFRNAAALALRDFPDANIRITIYDTGGTPAGAKAAVGTALGGGARLILGPVFAAEVSAVAPAARQAGVPVVAFSSDASVAGPGIYLLSFLPADDVKRVVAYAAGEGKQAFAALLPANSYGTVVEAAFRGAVPEAGGRILAIQSYQRTSDDIRAQAAAIARFAPQFDALLVPDSGDVLPAIASALEAAGITRDRVQLLGSGQWDDPRVVNSAGLVGAWFPAPTKEGFAGFARKYQAAYRTPPPRNATLAYDASVLAAGLVRQYPDDPFANAVLTSPNGFTGIDGVFRFLPSGAAERRLAVYEVTGSGARVVAPAARTFAAGG